MKEEIWVMMTDGEMEAAILGGTAVWFRDSNIQNEGKERVKKKRDQQREGSRR